MRVESQFLNRILYIRPNGEIDEYNAALARREVDKMAEEYAAVAQRVVFDLGEISFMDSTGIGFLIGRYKKLKSFNLPAYITGASFSTEKVIELAGLYGIMPKY